MRALRIFLIVAVALGGLFVVVDRVTVHVAEDEAAEKLRNAQALFSTPDVSIKGFPFITQLTSGVLDDVEVGIKSHEIVTASSGAVRISDLNADLRGIAFSSDYSSVTAQSATGTATVTYDELLKAAHSRPTDVGAGVTARVVGLSDGGNGKIKIDIEAAVRGSATPQGVSVPASVSVEGGSVRVRADSLPDLGIELPENVVRSITDFQQDIDDLLGGIKIHKVEGAADGVKITVRGSDVRLAG